MANFDPKTKIERLVLKHPALASIFKEAAATVDDQLTVEEFCFVNGIDFMDFFRRLDEAVAAAEQRDQEWRAASVLITMLWRRKWAWRVRLTRCLPERSTML